MTGKEALYRLGNLIENLHTIKYSRTRSHCEEYYKIILDDLNKLEELEAEKDLEVLDILREYFSCTEYGYWYIDLQESDFDYEYECSKEEWENSPQKKIKDWLKRKIEQEAQNDTRSNR